MITLTSGASTCTAQPATVNETPLPIQTDVTAIDGSMQRNKLNNKYQATLKYSDLAPSDYQSLMGVVNSGNLVSYSNTFSAELGGALNFTALATFTVGDYEPGASLWHDVTVTLRQI